MGFLDMDGSLGRKFGSVGVGLEEIETVIVLEPGSSLSAEGPDSDRALRAAQRLETALGQPLPARIRVEKCIPPHSGLGSGTQMALATGAGLARLHNLALTTPEIAFACERGRRSGIGIAAFDEGGLIVDAGRTGSTRTPPVISRLPFPEDWRFLVLLDPTHLGIHGKAEVAAFDALPPFPRETAAMLCHQLLMQGLPALIEADVITFGEVIHRLQATVGDHFAAAQGGRYTSQKVEKALSWLEKAGAVGMGQSSWGPTGFCLVDSAEKATSLLESIKIEQPELADLDIRMVRPRQGGATITPIHHG